MEPTIAPSIQQLTADAVRLLFRHGLLWYQIPAVIASLLLLVATFLGPAPRLDGAKARLLRSDRLYLLALVVFLLALRWPSLSVGDLEGDESVAVSAALTRLLEPAFGVTLFTGSAGPLLTYPVSALGLLGFRIDYGASKLISLLLIAANSSVLYLALRTVSEARAARVALLPLLAFLGFANVRWTVSYCSEQWINLLVISMLYFLLRLGRQIGLERTNLIGMGFALGLVSLIKWQGMPMAALVVACAVMIVWRRCRREPSVLGAVAVRLLPLAVLGLAPLGVWCLILASQGSLGFFLDTYFVALFSQATSRYPTTLLERLMALPEWGIRPFLKADRFASSTALFMLAAATVLCLLRRPRRLPPDLALATLYLVVSVYAVLQPGGQFTHYMNLLLQPYALLAMLVYCHLVSAVARPAIAVSAYLGITLLWPAAIYLRDAPFPVSYRPVNIRGNSIDALRDLGVAGSPMIQWGWVYAFYVHSGTTWGTRTGGSHEILEPFFPNQEMFIADFVESLESGRAPIFLDTAMEGSASYGDHVLFGHGRFPEVAKAVRRNYFRCAVFSGARLYLHRETYAERPGIVSWCMERQRGRWLTTR